MWREAMNYTISNIPDAIANTYLNLLYKLGAHLIVLGNSGYIKTTSSDGIAEVYGKIKAIKRTRNEPVS